LRLLLRLLSGRLPGAKTKVDAGNLIDAGVRVPASKVFRRRVCERQADNASDGSGQSSTLPGTVDVSIKRGKGRTLREGLDKAGVEPLGAREVAKEVLISRPALPQATALVRLEFGHAPFEEDAGVWKTHEGRIHVSARRPVDCFRAWRRDALWSSLIMMRKAR
jgi:hypothetical protein